MCLKLSICISGEALHFQENDFVLMSRDFWGGGNQVALNRKKIRKYKKTYHIC